ncbi:hypothetical protein HK105_206726 [Polyrhizophydium stewartii]|uniref:F-box domain-containing protein n=1 Tax=Polyrhizophydium stewartii TaxID=2732419 RepID=A0ABR4N2G6_9FUNG|nr:hypothetical protein HK105_007311 [Polyrhizophydium stewartii]
MSQSADGNAAPSGTPERVDIVARLPPEMALRILGELPVEDVVRCLGVSRTWNKLARDDSIWRELCRKRWADKFNHPHELHVRVDYTNLARDLSVREIKRILARRGITSAAKCVEKGELVELLKHTTPYGSPKVRLSPKWLASYAVAELDSKRTEISVEELTSVEWRMRLAQGWPSHMSTSARFYSDGTYDAAIFDRPMRWKFNNGRPQVAEYPPHHCTRTAEWGWILRNGYAMYTLPDSELPNPATRSDRNASVLSFDENDEWEDME